MLNKRVALQRALLGDHLGSFLEESLLNSTCLVVGFLQGIHIQKYIYIFKKRILAKGEELCFSMVNKSWISFSKTFWHTTAGTRWHLLNLLVPPDTCWQIGTLADTYWHLMTIVSGVTLCLLVKIAGTHWHLLTLSDICWHFWTLADTCLLWRYLV